MAIAGHWVKDFGFASIDINRCVAIPKIAVNQGWYEFPATGLQGTKQSWENFVHYRHLQLGNVRIKTLSLILPIKIGLDPLGKTLFPAIAERHW